VYFKKKLTGTRNFLFSLAKTAKCATMRLRISRQNCARCAFPQRPKRISCWRCGGGQIRSRRAATCRSCALSHVRGRRHLADASTRKVCSTSSKSSQAGSRKVAVAAANTHDMNGLELLELLSLLCSFLCALLLRDAKLTRLCGASCVYFMNAETERMMNQLPRRKCARDATTDSTRSAANVYLHSTCQCASKDTTQTRALMRDTK